MRAPLQAVLFDVGETLLLLDRDRLVQVLGCAPAALQDALLALRRASDARVLEALERGGTADGGDLARDLLGALGIDPARWPELGAALLRCEAELPGLWRIVPPEAGEVLAALDARGLRLGVLSNADGRVARRLELAGLARWFRAVLDSGTEGLAKPDPAAFQRAAAALGVDPGACLYVGDVYGLDVVAAERAGLQAILVDRDGRYARPGAAAVRSLRELPGLIP